jgi:hypothetical protein
MGLTLQPSPRAWLPCPPLPVPALCLLPLLPAACCLLPSCLPACLPMPACMRFVAGCKLSLTGVSQSWTRQMSTRASKGRGVEDGEANRGCQPLMRQSATRLPKAQASGRLACCYHSYSSLLYINFSLLYINFEVACLHRIGAKNRGWGVGCGRLQASISKAIKASGPRNSSASAASAASAVARASLAPVKQSLQRAGLGTGELAASLHCYSECEPSLARLRVKEDVFRVRDPLPRPTRIFSPISSNTSSSSLVRPAI